MTIPLWKFKNEMNMEFLYYIFVGILQELDDHELHIKFFKDGTIVNHVVKLRFGITWTNKQKEVYSSSVKGLDKKHKISNCEKCIKIDRFDFYQHKVPLSSIFVK